MDGDNLQYSLIPIDLDMRRENCLERGLPVIASPEEGERFAQNLTERSKRYETQFSYNIEDGIITIK